MRVREPRQRRLGMVYVVHGEVAEEQGGVVGADEDGGEGSLGVRDGVALDAEAGFEVGLYLGRGWGRAGGKEGWLGGLGGGGG